MPAACPTTTRLRRAVPLPCKCRGRNFDHARTRCHSPARMALYPLLRPLIFALDAERAHRLTIAALKLKPAGAPPAPDPLLAMKVAGLDFPNPIGLAAGFDKDAEVFA